MTGKKIIKECMECESQNIDTLNDFCLDCQSEHIEEIQNKQLTTKQEEIMLEKGIEEHYNKKQGIGSPYKEAKQ